jgi:hypothetical protein
MMEQLPKKPPVPINENDLPLAERVKLKMQQANKPHYPTASVLKAMDN